MKVYSYTNNNHNYTKAISLANVRSVNLIENSGKSAIRFSVRVDYCDNSNEHLFYLEQGEAKKVYKEIVDLLNE